MQTQSTATKQQNAAKYYGADTFRPDWKAIANMHLESRNYLIKQNEELRSWLIVLIVAIGILAVSIVFMMMEIEKLIELI